MSMTEKEFCKILGKLEAQGGYEEFVANIESMMSMLDETDEDDTFGTQGWRYHFGWEQ